VQVIEVTGYAVRSAVITLQRKGTPLKYVLFPMIHIASPVFYTQVRRRLESCDLIVAEGVKGTAPQLNMLTLAYRFAPRRRRNGLVEQSTRLLLPEGVPVINPDVTAADVVDELHKLPRWMYLLLLVAAPVLGLVFAVRGPRAFLDEDLVVDDLPLTLRAEHLAEHPVEAALLDERDKLLIDTLCDIHQARSGEPITVAVLYGAGHMPAVVAGLMERYGYRPRDAEWLTVLIPA
jgi:hypothetical protein